MPIATLKFKLPEELSEFKLASKSGDLMSVLHDIVAHLREITKYKEYKTTQESELAWQIRDDIWDILKDYEMDPYNE